MSVYAIKSDAGLIKVGMTNGDPSYRMASLQTGNPHVLALIAVLDTESAGVDHSILEAAIHRRLDRFRVVGEWFAAPDWLVLRVMAISFTEMTKPDLYGRWERRFGRYCRMWMVKLDRMVPKQAPLHKLCGTRHWSHQTCPTIKSTAAPVSEPRLGMSMPGKGASRTVPQASHADNREVVTGPHRESGETNSGATGGRQLQPALRTGVAPGAVDTITPLTVRGTPRKRAPKGTFDRKAYQRQKARERRAKLKADQSKRED